MGWSIARRAAILATTDVLTLSHVIGLANMIRKSCCFSSHQFLWWIFYHNPTIKWSYIHANYKLEFRVHKWSDIKTLNTYPAQSDKKVLYYFGGKLHASFRNLRLSISKTPQDPRLSGFSIKYSKYCEVRTPVLHAENFCGIQCIDMEKFI